MKKFVVMAFIAQIVLNYSVQAQEGSKKETVKKQAENWDNIMNPKKEKKLVKKDTLPVRLLADRSMIWGDTGPVDPEQVKRDKAYDEKVKKIEDAKENKLKEQEFKASKLATKNLTNKIIADSLSVIAKAISKAESEIREGLSSTNLRILSDRGVSERRNKELRDSLNHQLAQYQKIIENMLDSLKQGPSNSVQVSKNSPGVPGLKGAGGPQGSQGAQGPQGIPGKPGQSTIVTFQVPAQGAKSQATILNASNEQIGQAIADKIRHDSVFASQVAKILNNESKNQNGQVEKGSWSSKNKVGDNGNLTDRQVNQLMDSLLKKNLIGLIVKASNEQIGQAISERLKTDPALLAQITKAANIEASKNGLSSNNLNNKSGQNVEAKNDLSPSGKVRENEYLTSKQLKQITDTLIKKNLIAAIMKDSDDRIKQATNDSIINAKVAKAVAIILKNQGGQSGKNGVDGKNGIDGKNGKDGINGANGKDGIAGQNGSNGKDGLNGVNGKDGQNGQAGQNDYGSNGQNQNDLANQNRNIGPNNDRPIQYNDNRQYNQYNYYGEQPQQVQQPQQQTGYYSSGSGVYSQSVPVLNYELNYPRRVIVVQQQGQYYPNGSNGCGNTSTHHSGMRR